VIGPSANLVPFSSLTIIDVIYAMMLPRGNDAAFALAENIGAL